MWSAYLDSNPLRAAATRTLGRASRRAYYGPFAPLRVRHLGKPALPGSKWVRVSNRVAGISPEEVRLIHLESNRRASAMALPRKRTWLGREVVGEVIEVGAGVRFLRQGDRVAWQLDQCCATYEIEPPCRHCAAGNYALCENRYLTGPEPIGAGWGDEMVLHEHQLFLVPDTMTDEQAALLDPTASALHAVLRHVPAPGSQSLIMGADVSALLVIQCLRAISPNAHITVVPRYNFQVEMATLNGANEVLYPDDGTSGAARLSGARHLKSRFGPDVLLGGFDVVYDTSGTQGSLQRSLQWVRDGGAVVLAGHSYAPAHLDFTPIWHREITVIGALTHGAETIAANAATMDSTPSNLVGTISLAASMIAERRLAPERLITHRFPMREVRQALATARDAERHRALKIILDAREMPTTIPLSVDMLLSESSS
jgi:threonine dehydrogenase-like Zn-dependent dehydrogenase